MRSAWRIIAGGSCGVAAAVIWAVSLAVYQQLMEPTGSFTDPNTGQTYLNLAQNNTYWPREVRHMAILLAFAGVAVICRAGTRGLVAGAVGSAAWLGADLWLDRIDVDGRTAAWWLAAAGIVGFAAVAGVAAWLARGRPGTSRARFFCAGTLPVLAALTISITTPWDEPVTDPASVRIENALTLLRVGLLVLFLVATLALLVDGLTRARAWWVAASLAIATVVGGLTISANGQVDSLGLIMALFWLLAVAAAHEIPRTFLLVVAVVGAAMLALTFVVVLLGGMLAGPVLTSIAGNPEVNGADTDLSIALPGLVAGLLIAGATHAVTMAWPGKSLPRSVPTGAEA